MYLYKPVCWSCGITWIHPTKGALMPWDGVLDLLDRWHVTELSNRVRGCKGLSHLLYIIHYWIIVLNTWLWRFLKKVQLRWISILIFSRFILWCINNYITSTSIIEEYILNRKCCTEVIQGCFFVKSLDMDQETSASWWKCPINNNGRILPLCPFR